MTILSNFALRKMKLEESRCTEDIDKVPLKLRVFSAAESVFKLCYERYVFLEREKEISKKKKRENFQSLIFLIELQQFTLYNSTEQKCNTERF